MSSGGNSGSQATSLLIRALALREPAITDWWRVALREVPSGLALGAMLGLIGIVTFGSLTGSMLPFLLQRIGFDPASASAPFVATLVDVTGLVIYFSVASLILRGTLL